MSFDAFENYVFIPDPGNFARGTIYELSRSEQFDKNSFVLLAYSNPGIKKTIPLFYKIKSKTRLETPATLSSTKENKMELFSKTSKKEYIEKVKQLKEHIQQGNIYEINYCIELFSEASSIDPVTIFFELCKLAKAPYSMLLKSGNDFIICASPELFLKKESENLFTKPIKGTIRRGNTAEEDEQLKHELQNNLKERTENVMAVDVARNDLSMFAKKGTVHVNKLYNIETFETVHQMVSTVSCEIREGTSFETIIGASFPMASMTGAPKLRAMQLIGEFENFERSSYSGAMGIIDEEENYSLAVIIRSIFYNQQTKRLSVAVGGAITYLSDPEKEYEECLLKAKVMLKVLNATLVN